MKTEFKVMPWLRALRDHSAKEQEGLSDEERLRRHRELAKPMVQEFRRNHPESFEADGTPRRHRAKRSDQGGTQQPPP